MGERSWRISGGVPLRGHQAVPADKSVLHRALLVAGALPRETVLVARDIGEDNRSTAACLRALGAAIEPVAEGFRVRGLRPQNFRVGRQLDCGNSGTTARLLTGILVGADVTAELVGDASLSRRPMGRVCEPLRQMGGHVTGTWIDGEERLPVTVSAGRFAGGTHQSVVASAQAKSAALLAAWVSGRSVQWIEPARSRDHTEVLLQHLGFPIWSSLNPEGHHVAVGPAPGGEPTFVARFAERWVIPGDPSAAAFLAVAATLLHGSSVTLSGVSPNETRLGWLTALRRLGGQVELTGLRYSFGEPVADLTIQGAAAASGHGVELTLAGPAIPTVIDELPILAALALIPGVVVTVRDAQELRRKESDRIDETARIMRAFGCEVDVWPDGFRVQAGSGSVPTPSPSTASLSTASPSTERAAPSPIVRELDVGSDHRIALTAAVCALASPGVTLLHRADIADVSFPSFPAVVSALGGSIDVLDGRAVGTVAATP